MIDVLRNIICKKTPCEECDKYVSLKKSQEYWKNQREISYARAEELRKETETLKGQIDTYEEENALLNNINKYLNDEIKELNLEIEYVKSRKSGFFKTIPNVLRTQIGKGIGDNYVYLGGTFFKLYNNTDITFKPFNQHYNFYGGITSASMMLLMKAGLIDNNTGEVKTGFTAEEIFEKITIATQQYFTYVSDDKLFFFADCWVGGTLTTAFKLGDCECLHTSLVDAFNTYEYLTEPFVDYTCVLGLGYFRWSGTTGGHAFPMLIKNNIPEGKILENIWIGEATGRVGKPRTLKELKDNNIYYDCEWGLHGLMNEKNIFGGYKIKNEYVWWNDKQQYKE